MAIFVALKGAKIPKIELIDGESGLPEDFELASGDLADAIPLPLSNIPLIFTISKVRSTYSTL